MIISIASGKGGTGKTTVAVNFALSLEGDKIQFLDCDVEEPNADIFLKPIIDKQEPFYTPKPVVDESKCTYCGRCSEVCLYNAIAVVKERVLIFYELCHSCGACKVVCPQEAILELDIKKGTIEEGKAGAIEFVKGELEVSEASPTPLVRAVKKKIKANYISIIDVSPGISCPVVEAVKDSNFCILVTEPTPFGLNDLKLAIEMCKKLKVPIGVIINRVHKHYTRTQDPLHTDVGYEEMNKY
ncbi:MAG TPA: 4Fe-4S dicluster domain-containing protein, partial [bacterium (Candidatus Stahlbacteria)]|nr:4Fe-4S dicluster domain-containing protein [Candidatus Stahlbacteria bacterium]